MSELRDLAGVGDTKSLSGLGRHILELNKAAKSFGVHLEYLTDFNHFREVVEAIPGRSGITRIFDSHHCDIGPDNGYWIKGTDEEGQVVHVQAYRFDDLRDGTLAEHWQANPEGFSPPGLEIDLEKSNFHTAPVSHEISGTVCYHGDFWIDSEFRNMRIGPILTTFGMLLAASRFTPDYIYCFVVPRMVRRGWPTRAGYLHLHPWAPSWYISGQKRTYDDYLVWVTSQELIELWTSRERDTDILGLTGEDDDSRSSVMQRVARH